MQSEQEQTTKKNTGEIALLSELEAHKEAEGLCREAEMYWTAFLVESKLWDGKPQIIDLISPSGQYLGKAIQKNAQRINEKIGKDGDIFFGQESYLILNTKIPELRGALVVFDKSGKVLARKFGLSWRKNENYFKDRASLMAFGNDDRMEKIQLIVDLIKESNSKKSLKQIFREHLEWAKS